MGKIGINLWTWFFAFLAILIIISVISNSMVRHSIYDDITGNIIDEMKSGKPQNRNQEEAQVSASPSCKSEYIEQHRCDGNNLQQKYQYKDCNVDWIKIELCDYGCAEGRCNPKPKEHTYNLSLCKGSADCFIGKVTKIVDGDTLDVNRIRIRLALVNTPERYENGFFEAKLFIEDICPVGSSVLVDEDDGQTSGSYDRTIAVVYCDDYNISKILLELGYGKITWTKYCKVSEFRNENWAIKHGC